MHVESTNTMWISQASLRLPCLRRQKASKYRFQAMLVANHNSLPPG